jgi:uncharacterized protein (DUF58 family)
MPLQAHQKERTLLTGFTLLFFSGFFLASSILIGASFIPLFIYFAGALIQTPKVRIKRMGLPSSAMLGQTIGVEISGKVTGGIGTVIVFDEIPEPFELIEGSNYKVVSKEFGERDFDFAYRIRCTKCGDYMFNLGYETRHILGHTTTSVSIEENERLTVFPMLHKIRKMKLPILSSRRTYPVKGVTKIGPLSTDFKEIRNYFYGDPFKIINWKASARAASLGKTLPLVNEYEREGKPTVWIFFDANPDLMIGTTTENVLDYSVQIAYNASYYFLKRGYSLGMYIYNHRGEHVQSGTGKRQFVQITNKLLHATHTKSGLGISWEEGFAKAFELSQSYFDPRSTVIVIITHVAASNFGDLVNGLMQILARKRMRRYLDVLLINILPYNLVPKTNNWETFAAETRDVASRSFSGQLRNLGLTVLDWEPKEESMELVLSKTIWLR